MRRGARSNMISSQLLKATRTELKTLDSDRGNQVEKDFILSNWQFFAEDKGAVKGALFQHPKTGNELLQTLGIQNVTIHKVTKEALVKSVLKMEGSEIFNAFMEDVKVFKELTAIFIVSKRALMMSNNQVFNVPGKFMHKLESTGNLPDIYWQWAENLAGKVSFY